MDVKEIIERFVRLRVLKTKGGKEEVARETTLTLLSLVQIQFGAFGVRELIERMKDFIEWEISQLEVNLNSNEGVNEDFRKSYC